MSETEFKFKGTFLIATKKFLEREFGIEYTSSKWLKYYQESNMLASSWYPAKPIIDILNESANEKKYPTGNWF